MVPAKPKRYKKSIHKLSVAAIEFVKTYLVMDRRLAVGISAYELSFMLGKNDFFVRDVENPLNTKRYNIDDTNYLLLIFNERLPAIMPSKTEQDIYHLEIAFYLNEIRVPHYEIAIKDTKTGVFVHFKTVEVTGKHAEPLTDLALFSFNELQAYINTLFATDYFENPKRALDVYRNCKTYFGEDFHPRYMIKVLNYYTNKKSGVPKLNKGQRDDFGRTLFSTEVKT